MRQTSLSRASRPVAGLACLVLAAGACAPPPTDGAPPSGQVVVLSLDGLSHALYSNDPAAAALRTLQDLERQGGRADGVQSTFPSTTASAHAALWTGVYGSLNGITANDMPRLPRSRHTFLERLPGFRAEGLLVEPLWAVAARQGVRVLAHETPQGFPFLPINTAPGAPVAPVIANGYQTRRFAPYAWITEETTTPDADPQTGTLASARPPRFVRWTSGDLAFRAAIVASAPDGPYDSMIVRQLDGDRSIRVTAHATDEDPLEDRPLARHFVGLPVTMDERFVSGVSFRLFELAADGERFALLQSEVRETAVYDGTETAADTVADLVTAEGGFVGNAAGVLYASGRLGPPLWAGGDGQAEARYLETVELVVRQFSRHASWLRERYAPRLMLDYLPFPDEAEHTWLGLQQAARRQGDALAARWEALRSRMYAIVDRRVASIAGGLTPEDALVVVGDHGLTAVDTGVRVNLALARAGLLTRTADGRIAADRSAAVYGRQGILLNEVGWRGGIVDESRRAEILERARTAVESLIDPATGRRVVDAVFTAEDGADRSPPGLWGPASADLYLDFADGYRDSPLAGSELVEPLPRPLGDHGGDPRRPELWTMLIVRAPGVAPGTRWPMLRIVDVTSLVSDLLGIAPPPDAEGRSPLR